ncbi:MAG: endonuclease III [Flavobacterium sp.]|nr:endonuclease III [Flavobacterium sp.]
MDPAQQPVDWPKAFKELIDRYRGHKHVLDYKNLYQLTVMVVLAAQDRDANINKLTPALFEAFPDMKALSKASTDEIIPYISKVRGHRKKADWLQNIATAVGDDKNIPTTMKELTALKGIGRKSANVIMREAGVELEGIMCDLHVVRVAPRLGITNGKDATKIEKDLMAALPKKMWTEAGSALSFLGRETCRPTNPKHSECVMSSVCAYCHEKNGDC